MYAIVSSCASLVVNWFHLIGQALCVLVPETHGALALHVCETPQVRPLRVIFAVRPRIVVGAIRAARVLVLYYTIIKTRCACGGVDEGRSTGRKKRGLSGAGGKFPNGAFARAS